jgi:hypothetical protein
LLDSGGAILAAVTAGIIDAITSLGVAVAVAIAVTITITAVIDDDAAVARLMQQIRHHVGSHRCNAAHDSITGAQRHDDVTVLRVRRLRPHRVVGVGGSRGVEWRPWPNRG